MAPIAVFVAALLLAAANSQTTQALAATPWLCMRTTANESTGEVWAELWHCRWNKEFHISAPNASDGTIQSGDGQCLIGGSEGDGQCFFDKCEEGSPLQKWEFVAAGVTAEKLATPDGADSVPGQIALVSAEANMDRPQMCLEGNYGVAEGTRVLIVPCDNTRSGVQTWMYAPPPPSNKVLLFMPALHALGEKACVGVLTGFGVPDISDCDDEDLVANWFVRDGDLILLAAGGGWCLWFNGRYVAGADGNCEPADYNKWILGKDGSLTLIEMPEVGCLTYKEAQDHITFHMETCTGDGKQNFAFLNVAPATDAVQVA